MSDLSRRPTQLYRHYNAAGELLYVGISLSTVRRLQQHRQSADWFADIARIEVQHFPDRATAEQAEVAAIQSERPKHNRLYSVEGPPREWRDGTFEGIALRADVRLLKTFLRAPEYRGRKYSEAEAAELFSVRPLAIRLWQSAPKFAFPEATYGSGKTWCDLKFYVRDLALWGLLVLSPDNLPLTVRLELAHDQ